MKLVIYDKSIDIENIIDIIIKANKIALVYYNLDTNLIGVKTKDDLSPVTLADKKVSEFISQELKNLGIELPMIDEEQKEIPYEVRKNYEYYWCLDPIDGPRNS